MPYQRLKNDFNDHENFIAMIKRLLTNRRIVLFCIITILFCIIILNQIELKSQFSRNNSKLRFLNKLNPFADSYEEQCLNLYKKLRYPDQKMYFRPPLKEIPPEMYDDFTQNGLLPNRKYWYFDNAYSDSNSDDKQIMHTISKEEFDNSLNLVRTNQPLGYGDQNLNKVMTSYKSHIAGKTMAVIGTEWSWVEAIAYNNQASHTTTLDYTRKKYETEGLTWLHVNDYYDSAIENKMFENFDNAASFSSIEHSGLGRYGDPLSPYGDVEAVKQVHCMLKPGGLFFLGLPCSPDNSSFLEFNAYRVYGTTRLNLLFEGWKLLEQEYETAGFQKIFVLQKI